MYEHYSWRPVGRPKRTVAFRTGICFGASLGGPSKRSPAADHERVGNTQAHEISETEQPKPGQPDRRQDEARSRPVRVGVKATLNVTVKNVGGSDAGTFDVGLGYARADGLGSGALSPQTVDELVAGSSAQIPFNVSVDTAADYTFTASADANAEITESNEDDNTNELTATAVALPNLYLDGAMTIDPVIAPRAHNCGGAVYS